MSHKTLSEVPTEQDLIESIRLGGKTQEVAFLYINRDSKFRNALRKFLFANNGKEQDVMPVFNEGLIALYRKIISLDESKIQDFSLWGYFYRSCQFIWYKELEKSKKNLGLLRSLMDGIKLLFKRTSNNQSAFDDDMRNRVEELIDELGEPKRSVLLLKEMGLSYREIKEKLNLSSENNARRIHYNAKNSLFQKVKTLYPEGI